MGDVLSQNEIDNLLAALSTGELDVDEIKDNNEKKVKEYDFARPSKFSKEHLRTMEMIFEHYGRLLSKMCIRDRTSWEDSLQMSWNFSRHRWMN